MEQSLVMYRISKVKHKLNGYMGAQPLDNDNGKVTALTVNKWELLINGLMAVNALVHDEVDLSQFIHK